MANVLTNVGKGIIAKRMLGATPAQAEPNKIGWGTGTTAAAATDTALTTPAPEARVTATSSTVTTAQANDTYQLVGTLTSAAGATIAEVGVFDATSSGNMLGHCVFTGVALAAGEGIQFTIGTQIS